MKIFIDCEFIEYPGTLELLSIGLAAENGQTFYAVRDWTNGDYSRAVWKCPEETTKWLNDNVMPQLMTSLDDQPVRKLYPALLGKEIRAWVAEQTDSPQFCGYFCDYDWVLFCWLQGSMSDLPPNWPMYCWDLKQYLDDNHVPLEIQPPNPLPHHALADAQHELAHYRKAMAWVMENRRLTAPETDADLAEMRRIYDVAL